MSKENTKKRRRLKLNFSLRMAKGSDIWIHLAMIGLMFLGTIVIASATMGLSVGKPKTLILTVVKQIIFIIAGYVGMTWLSRRFRLKILKTNGFMILLVVTELVLLSTRLFPAVGGAHAWIRIPGLNMTLQPSEFAKITAMLMVAAYLGDVKKKHFDKWYQLWDRPVLIGLLYVLTVLVLQDDFGSALGIFVITCVCMLIPRHHQLYGFQFFLRVAFWIVMVIGFVVMSPWGNGIIEHIPMKEYQRKRFLSANDPFVDQYGSGYQLINGLIAFATGGWFGLGFGNSVRKYMEFPAANTDYALSILVEELGFAGFLVLMLFYGTIIVRLMRYAMKIKSERAKIILIGTSVYFLVHIIFNIGGVTGLIPLTGIPLLMISSGGSSTMSIMCAIGISQAVIASYKNGEIE